MSYLYVFFIGLFSMFDVLQASNRNLPAISSFKREESGRVTLEIESSGDPGEFIDVFYCDNLTDSEWKLGGKYLRAQGEPKLIWPESEAGFTPPLTGMRFFRIGRADIDLNENGISDAREALMHMHDIEPASRARWARAGLGSEPPDFATVINVKDYGAKGNGVNDDTGAINDAIAAVPTGGVVYLPAGIYLITDTIYLKSDMILRGDGSVLTSLIFQGIDTDNRCIGIMRWNGDQSTDYVEVTDGMNIGSAEITVSSVSGFEAGDIIEIDEDNDPAWGLDASWQSNLPCQMNRIVAVDYSRKTLTLDHHLRHDYSPGQNPRMRRMVIISDVGIEKLYIRRQDAVEGFTIEMKYAVRCWIRQIESYMTYRGHVWMGNSFECEVRGSYFHDSFVFGGGGQGYGVACGKGTSDCLIEDNVFRHLRHSMIVGIGANGNVYGYNFSTQRAIDPKHGTPQPDISVHGNYVFMNLFEGNVLEDADVPDWYEPAGPGNTLIRNRITNSGTAIDVGSDNQNFIGNVLTEGTITTDGVLQGVLDDGNVKEGDTQSISWSDCDCRTLPDSFYRSVPPNFILNTAGISWPPIGPDEPLDAEIPAKLRYDTGLYVAE